MGTAAGDHRVMTLSGSLTTIAGPGTLEKIGSELERTWSAYAHIPPDVRMHMTIAVAEIAANIVEHTQPVNIQMEIRVLPHQVHVVFSDDGEPAKVDIAAATMPTAAAERGRGLALAISVLDTLAYYRDSLNRWTLISRSFSPA